MFSSCIPRTFTLWVMVYYNGCIKNGEPPNFVSRKLAFWIYFITWLINSTALIWRFLLLGYNKKVDSEVDF